MEFYEALECRNLPDIRSLAERFAPDMHYRLHCIIDSAGKSLHAWFDAPRNKVREARLKAGLVAFGCDPRAFTFSQPVRVPGAWREGKLQRLVWLED